jgi:hypothetical protein
MTQFIVLDLDFCYFCRGQNTRYFVLQFCMMVVYRIGSIHVFFMNFFKALKFDFFLGLNKELHRAHVPKRRTRGKSIWFV